MIDLDCMIGFSASRQVLVGFAPSDLLARLSFADILNEDTGLGYQRRFNSRHSQDFRRYIRLPESSTIPLTLNLRPVDDDSWRVEDLGDGRARLHIKEEAGKVMAQVDCQHRLGSMGDLSVPLPFMIYMGLNIRDETEVFRTINSKAKGLSTSLLDFHDAQLADDLGRERPELFVALHINHDEDSPWHRRLDLGGETTSGLMRRASLRTMQVAVKRFHKATRILKTRSAEHSAQVLLAFWRAVVEVLPEQWADHRRTILSKGVGVYALMDLAAEIYNEAIDQTKVDRRYFVNKLSEFAHEIDWSSQGVLGNGLGGEKGADVLAEQIAETRRRANVRLVSNG